MILTIRTDKPQAEVGLYEADKKLEYILWEAGRSLSQSLHEKIEELLGRRGIDYSSLIGVVIYKGPGSFTGLRIGASVANALAGELDIPIAGSSGEDWIVAGIGALKAEPGKRLAVLDYGSEPKTTKPKK